MRSQPHASADDGADPTLRCVGDCQGIDATLAAIGDMMVDDYRGEIDRARVWFADVGVNFDVLESSSGPPGNDVTVSHWQMALDGDLIAFACEDVCLRSPTTRAALAAHARSAVTRNRRPADGPCAGRFAAQRPAWEAVVGRLRGTGASLDGQGAVR